MGGISGRVKKILRQQGGFTIVTVLAAFVLLLIGISMFSKAAVMSVRLEHKAKELNRESQRLLEVYYGLEEGEAQEQERQNTYQQESEPGRAWEKVSEEAKREAMILYEADGTARIRIGR